ncbi:uncharacterized protein F5891DRAFT_992683 [Suillus fuscotomentosus]|uniref:Uncharacterized protein n=1 Tax=Suillus fuscotomentosus TaxID=1912939 RepID=A0AAD4EPB0_9AGAM|nr:uncharacterized protein F5891DRAFT_992683 [Suillus fuscotomentosus]KAG1908358.1 hypothetical protein F5891DRAFT_992683 [Suillus fuscotomentosus]
MNFRKTILRTVSVVLSSFGILLSVLAIFIQTLLPSHWQWAWSKPPPYAGGKSRRTIIARRVKRPVPRPVASPTSSFLRSTRSHETIRSSMVDRAVPQSHAHVDLPASLMPATKLPIQRSSHGEVSKAHRIFKRHTLPASLFVNSCRTIASLKQRSTHLKGRNSTGSFSSSVKIPDPPLRTQPYAAPYFFPVPGTLEAIDYVAKTREELLRPSEFMQANTRNKRT